MLGDEKAEECEKDEKDEMDCARAYMARQRRLGRSHRLCKLTRLCYAARHLPGWIRSERISYCLDVARPRRGASARHGRGSGMNLGPATALVVACNVPPERAATALGAPDTSDNPGKLF